MNNQRTVLTREQKWHKLNNPQCLSDYGISLDEDELRTFKGGRGILLAVRKRERLNKKLSKACYEVGEAIGREEANMMLECLGES